MIRTLRALFLALHVREKLLITSLVVLLLLLWAGSTSKRIGLYFAQSRATSAELKDQRQWLANKARIEAQVREGSKLLDASRTLDGTRLLAEVTTMADEAGLKNTATAESQDVTDGHFSIHTLIFSVNKADWASLKEFYTELQKRSPYIGVEQFTLQNDRAAPALLDASMKISSVEIATN